MPIIIVSGAAQAFAHHPRASDPLTDNEALARIHGAYSDEVYSETLDESLLQEIGISGGRLRFEHHPDESALRITTPYDVPRDINSEEERSLWKRPLPNGAMGLAAAASAIMAGSSFQPPLRWRSRIQTQPGPVLETYLWMPIRW